MFKNRKDAGEQLAQALERYKAENPLILAIPRGEWKLDCRFQKNWALTFPL